MTFSGNLTASAGAAPLSGTWSVSGSGQGCDTSLPISQSGSLSISLTTQAVTRVTLQGTGCQFSGFGGVNYVSGEASASCIDGSLSGTLNFYATGSSTAAPPTTLGTPGTTTNPTGTFAEPVNTATGNYYSTLTDLSVQGRGLNFVFNRSYNSLDIYAGPLWRRLDALL